MIVLIILGCIVLGVIGFIVGVVACYAIAVSLPGYEKCHKSYVVYLGDEALYSIRGEGFAVSGSTYDHYFYKHSMRDYEAFGAFSGSPADLEAIIEQKLNASASHLKEWDEEGKKQLLRRMPESFDRSCANEATMTFRTRLYDITTITHGYYILANDFQLAYDSERGRVYIFSWRYM